MKKIINLLAGGEAATPAKKAVVWAALGTLAALILAIAILVVSSIALTLTDNVGNEPERENDDGDGAPIKTTVEFVTLENISELAGKVDSTTASLQSKRTPMPESEQTDSVKRYYDAWTHTVPAKTQAAIDALLVEYYTQKKDNNILVSSSDATTVTVTLSDADKVSDCTPITSATHKWIFDNAYKYGLIYTENRFQYVGVALATYLRDKSDLTEVKAKTADSALTLLSGFRAYYVSADATEIKVPKSVSYEVIADGADGYIVIYSTK